MATTQFTISVPAELHASVIQQARRENRTVSGQIRHWIVEAMRCANGASHPSPSPLPWIREAKERLTAMQAEKARLEKIETADAEARARQLGLDIHVLGTELAVAERLLAPA